MHISILILGFLVCAALIISGGAKLSIYGDIIAELTGMGKAWLGLIIMAAVTSLPELFTGFGAVLIDSPNLAVGDIMGSCVFNLLILALLNYFIPQKSLYSLVAKGHLLAAFLGIFLITLSIIVILFGSKFPVLGWISTSSLLLIMLYLIAMWIIFNYEKKQVTYKEANVTPTIHPRYPEIPLKEATKRYIYYAFLVIIGGITLPYFSDGIANISGLNKTFVGSLLLAITTSLPELVVAVSAIKIKSLDIAVGNLLGSNIFNMLILSLDDLMYRKGALLEAVNPIHALTGLVAVLMTSVVGITIFYGSVYKRFVLGVDDLILILMYLMLMFTLYKLG